MNPGASLTVRLPNGSSLNQATRDITDQICFANDTDG